MTVSAKLEVRPALEGETFKDMVRVPKKYRPVKNGRICSVMVGKRSVLVSARGLDKRSAVIKIDEYVRDMLNVQIGGEYEFEIKEACWLGKIRWHCTASDPAVRIPAQLGAVSLFLGVSGLILGIIK